MSDKALKNAQSLREHLLERKKQLQREIAVVDANLDRIEAFIADWHSYAGGKPIEAAPPEMPAKENKRDGSRKVAKRTTGNSSKEQVAETAIEVIHERGEPVPRSELYRALVARGMTIAGVNPEMVLSTMLWRMKHRVARLKSGGYWPADEANEAADYHPPTSRRPTKESSDQNN